MASSLKKDQSKIRPINWHWYFIDDRKKYQRWNMSGYYRYPKANHTYIKNYDKNKWSLRKDHLFLS